MPTNTKMYEFTCEVCLIRFKTIRIQSVYCSQACFRSTLSKKRADDAKPKTISPERTDIPPL